MRNILILALLTAGCTAQAAAPAKKARARYSAYIPGACKVTDGDTIRCGRTSIRLVEIDAPEMPGHCRTGRVCVQGDPRASKAALTAFIVGQPLRVRRYGTDAYRRVLGDVQVAGVSASCAQIKGGYAEQQLKWADYGVTARCK